MTLQITDENFEEEVTKSNIPVLVDFWAEWCGPCRMLSPVLDSLSTEFEGKVKIVKVNIDDNPFSPQKFNVRSIPTLILFKDGKAVETKVGALSKSDLTNWLNSAS